MTCGRTGGALGQVEHLFRSGTVSAMTEGQLLGRFADDRDEAAFAALIAIHGPMVLGVCRRTLPDPHDADDAFQATFLVLARKAGAIRHPEQLGPWLHGVARRVAARSRSRAARRRARECPGAERSAVAPAPDPDRHELGAVLDEEIGRLPEGLRRPVVLCYLEGRTQEEAARDLCWTPGTVRGRLAKAREILRSRIDRRGLAPSGTCTGGLFPFLDAPAAVPPTLAMATVRTAIPFAAGQTPSAGPGPATALAEGVLRAMIVTPARIAAAALLTAGLAALPFALASEPRAAVTAAPAPSPTAEEVFARMARAYADARSYEDEGEVTLVFSNATGKRTQTKAFSTRFVRPRLYRFEFVERTAFDEPNRFVIWSDSAPDRAKTWWTIKPVVEEQTLTLAVGGAAGISSRSSLTVPQLLMPEDIRTGSLTDLKGLKLLGEEEVDGARCDKVEGTNARGDVETVWVDKATSLIRKFSGSFKIPGGEVEQTAVYRPRAGVEIGPKAFEFEPPGLPKP